MTIFGWDMSHYDAPGIGAAVREGYVFITHKIGGDATDMEADDWWNSVKGLSPTQVLLGGYWVLRPDLPGSATEKADRFIARLDAVCPGWRNRPFILQVDCERWSDSSGKKMPNRAYIKTFCDRLRVKMPKLMPVVYASAGEYGDNLKGLGYPLWNARYRLGYQEGTGASLYARSGGDTGKGWDVYSGKVPIIWQFTSSAKIAGQTTCDANAFRGTLSQLIKLLAPGWVTEPAKPVTPPSEELPVDPAAFNKLMDGWAATPNGKAALAALNTPYGSEYYAKRDDEMFKQDLHGLRDFLVEVKKSGVVSGGDTKFSKITPDSPIAKLLTQVEEIHAIVESMKSGGGTLHASGQ